jgi:hypothetical protein
MFSESLQILKISFSIQILNRSVTVRARNFGQDMFILPVLTFGIFTVRILSLCSTDIALSVFSHKVIVKQLLMFC